MQQLLASILEAPHGDHADAVKAQLPREGALLDAHVASVVRALQNLRSELFTKSFTSNGGVALHTVLYHLLGGASGNVPPPPRELSEAERKRCKPGWTAANPASTKFYDQMREARAKAKSGDDSKLKELRRRVFDPAKHTNLRPANEPPPAAQKAAAATTANAAAATTTTAASSDPDPSANPAVAAELRRRASCCLALATGTHSRLGLGSGVRLLAGKHDVLRLISKHAELRTTDWLASPPPKELRTLRRHLVLEHAELLLTREQRDEALVLAAAANTRSERLQRQLADAECRVQLEIERVEEVRAAAQHWKQLVEQQCQEALKQQRQRHAAAMRQQNRELTDLWSEERELRLELDALRVREAEDREGDCREDLARYRQRELGATHERADFERRFEEAQQAATRLRSQVRRADLDVDMR